jgi:hypothetical protein
MAKFKSINLDTYSEFIVSIFAQYSIIDHAAWQILLGGLDGGPRYLIAFEAPFECHL